MIEFMAWVSTLGFESRLRLLAGAGEWVGAREVTDRAEDTLKRWISIGRPATTEHVMRALAADLCEVAQDLQPGIVRIIGRTLRLPGA